MKDVLLFLITFAVIMIAFSSGVSYIFNMASGKASQNRGHQNQKSKNDATLQLVNIILSMILIIISLEIIISQKII